MTDLDQAARYLPVQGFYHAQRLTVAGTAEDAFTRSLTSARVEMNPHQVEAALSFDHAGVEKFGNVRLYQTDDFSFAEGVQEIVSRDSATTTVQFQSTLRRIGSIYLRHDYDDEDSID